MSVAQVKPTSAFKVLIIDDQQAMRQIIRESLYRLGIRIVVMAGTAAEAMRAMKSDTIDLVLSDYNLGDATDGQQLLEAARSSHLLSPIVPWIFITANSLKADILAAGDFMPDGYIVKPFTDQLLSRYIEALSARKRSLAPLLQAVDSKQWEEVLRVAEEFAKRTDSLSVEGVKQKALALMKLGRFDEARATYQGALALNTELTWAQLGHAQALRALGKLDAARDVLQQLTRDQPAYASAYDVLLEIAEETGDQDGALTLAKTVAELVPNAKRKLKLGAMALQAGETDTAVKALEQAFTKNKHSVNPTPQDSMLLSQALLDSGDAQKAATLLGEMSKRFPNRPDAQLMSKALGAQAQQRLGNTAAAQALMAEMEDQMPHVQLDEMAKLMVAKSALATGRTELGTALINQVARNNTDQPMMLAAALRAAAGSPVEAECRALVAAAGEGVQTALQSLQAAKRSGDVAKALEIGQQALATSPTHFSVMIELCTLHLIAMTRLGSAKEHAEAARKLLSTLERSHPDHDRVAGARKFFRERVGA